LASICEISKNITSERNFSLEEQTNRNELVPGQLLSAANPNCVKLDTESGERSWHAASEKWIPEEGLYDHLVLKLVKE
jgi:hypothetical protein